MLENIIKVEKPLILSYCQIKINKITIILIMVLCLTWTLTLWQLITLWTCNNLHYELTCHNRYNILNNNFRWTLHFNKLYSHCNLCNNLSDNNKSKIKINKFTKICKIFNTIILTWKILCRIWINPNNILCNNKKMVIFF